MPEPAPTSRPRFALFCKSFRRDVQRCVRLVESVQRYARDPMPLVLSVPADDLALFRARLPAASAELVSDEAILGRGVKQSWRSQQVVKLEAWRLGFADAWLIVDSDCAFVRPFSESDFVDPAGNVAFVASRILHVYDRHERKIVDYLRGEGDLDLPDVEGLLRMRTGRPQLAIPWTQRYVDAVAKSPLETRIPRIQAFFGREGPELHFQPMPVWTRASFEALERELLAPRGLRAADLIRYSPWEAIWMGEWEVYRGLPKRFVTECYFLHFITDEAIERARAARLTTDDFAERYIGLQLAAGHQQIEAY
ncbi:MAG TPA: DUF6492 family protein [Polyangiaceae bacterium]|nr:DUF6492 family protein [Polyangiaceae bacterium]